MAAGEIHVGDVVQFISTIKKTELDADGNTVVVTQDISSATTKDFLFQTPDGSLLTLPGSFYTDGTDGILMYVTNNSDLNQPGQWRYQIHIIYNSNEQHTDITKFKVLANLPLI
jgi:hypothetical protein